LRSLRSFYNGPVNSWDVIIAGAGIIGVSLALELRERGATVLVLDRGEPGRGASEAAAGMLAPSDPATPAALRPLAFESARMFPEYVRRLESLSGLGTDFRRQGTIVLGESPEPQDAGGTFAVDDLRPDNLRPDHLRHRSLHTDDLRRLEPWLASCGLPAFFVAEESVDPRLLMPAATLAAQKRGVEIRAHEEVTEMRACGSGVEVVTAKAALAAGAAVNCRGAWSGTPVRPRKGQMLYLQPAKNNLQPTENNLLRHVVRTPEVYLVPRSSGKILVGATVEDVGFDTSVASAAIQEMAAAAARCVAPLKAAEIVESWAGLRPGTPDDLPVLGATETPGVFVASGHFRNGILLAPVTARIMAELVAGKAPGLDIGAFAVSRFSRGNAGNAENSALPRKS
jgi:glycine oxidase